MKLGLHANLRKPAAADLVRRALAAIGDRASVVLTDELKGVAGGRPTSDWAHLASDLVIVIGGDGTFLRALRETAAPILPVNAGTLGVLAEVDGRPADRLEAAVERVLERRYFLEERAKLSADLEGTALPDATNEYVLHAPRVGKMGDFELAFDGVPAGRVRADGLIVATATGSTAYALSSLGPIVEPEVDAIVLAAIAPFRVGARALVLSGLRTVRLRPLTTGGPALVLADGDGEWPLPVGRALTVFRSPRRAALVRFGASFLDRLKGKRILPWSEDDGDDRGDAVLPPPP